MCCIRYFCASSQTDFSYVNLTFVEFTLTDLKFFSIFLVGELSTFEIDWLLKSHLNQALIFPFYDHTRIIYFILELSVFSEKSKYFHFINLKLCFQHS